MRPRRSYSLLKANEDVGSKMIFESKNFNNVSLGTYFNGSCATRRNGFVTVQGFVNRSAAESEAPLPLLVIDMKIDTIVSEASLNVAKLMFCL